MDLEPFRPQYSRGQGGSNVAPLRISRCIFGRSHHPRTCHPYLLGYRLHGEGADFVWGYVEGQGACRSARHGPSSLSSRSTSRAADAGTPSRRCALGLACCGLRSSGRRGGRRPRPALRCRRTGRRGPARPGTSSGSGSPSARLSSQPSWDSSARSPPASIHSSQSPEWGSRL